MRYAEIRATIRAAPTDGDKLVVCALALHANGDDQAWPSLETLAALIGWQERSVRRRLRCLEDLGLIERVVRGGGRGRTNVWAVKKGTVESPFGDQKGGPAGPNRGDP